MLEFQALFARNCGTLMWPTKDALSAQPLLWSSRTIVSYVSFNVRVHPCDNIVVLRAQPRACTERKHVEYVPVASSVIQHALGKVVSLSLPSTSAITRIRRIAPSGECDFMDVKWFEDKANYGWLSISWVANSCTFSNISVDHTLGSHVLNSHILRTLQFSFLHSINSHIKVLSI